MELNKKKHCFNCNAVLIEGKTFEDFEGNEYCDKCKSKFEAIADDFCEEDKEE